MSLLINLSVKREELEYESVDSDLILEQSNVVVRGLGVEFSFPQQVDLQGLHVEPEVSSVRVTLRRITVCR